ncbi:MAG: hypothetical protein ACM3S1_08540 [Hyphomicrobiales bacterium]
MSHQPAGLELDTHIDFQRRAWRFQNAGRIAFVVLILAALIGLLGPGWLSSSEKSAGDDLRVSYNRFVRWEAPTNVEVRLLPNGRDSVQLEADRDYIEAMHVEQVVPEPASVIASEDRVAFEFRPLDPDRALTVDFQLKPQRFGKVSGRFGLQGGPSVGFSQFVYPEEAVTWMQSFALRPSMAACSSSCASAANARSRRSPPSTSSSSSSSARRRSRR